MQDNRVLTDLREARCSQETVADLEQSGIDTYSQLFALLRDEQADSALRLKACNALFALGRTVDRRRAAPPLLVALRADNDELRIAAARALGQLGSKRAVGPLLKLAADRAEAISLRFEAVYELGAIGDERTLPMFTNMMLDPAEDVRVRAAALEWSPYIDGFLDNCIHLLADESADVRFWAAYRLSWHEDTRPALAELDRVAAEDHTLPQSWGWHVDREALLPLENIYFAPYEQTRVEDGDEYVLPYHTWLISPAAEYGTFMRLYRKWREDWFYDTLPELPVDLAIEPDWLKDAIRQAWPDAAFDVRQPRPKTYILEWHLAINGQNLIGGLHRDRYGVVVTGAQEAVCAFATWYRSIIGPHVNLYLYEWADEGLELRPGMTSKEIADELQNRDKRRSSSQLTEC